LDSIPCHDRSKQQWLKNSIAWPLGEKRRARMLYKHRSRDRDTFAIIRDCQEQTLSTPTALITTDRIAIS